MGVVGGGGAEVGEGVEVGVGVVAGAGDGAEKEPLAFSKGDECHWPSKSGLGFFGLGGCLKSHDGLAHGSGFRSSSGALFASAQRWSFGERACAVRCWGRASLWAGVSRRVRGWQARAFSARFSPPTCASCGRTGSARALLPPPADLGQYPGYRRAGGGGCSRAARVGCNAETASVRRRLSHRRPAAVPWGALRRSCAAFACAPRSGMCPREDDLSRQPARAGVYPGRARKAVIYSYSQVGI